MCSLSLFVEGPPSPLFCCLSVFVPRSFRGLLPHIKLHSPSAGESGASCVGCLVSSSLLLFLSRVCGLCFLVLFVVFLSSVVFPQWFLDLWCLFFRSRLCVVVSVSLFGEQSFPIELHLSIL